jgi:hypothetical protein
MATTVLKLLLTVAGSDSGSNCRRCGESMPAADEFGVSEGVCGPCRLHADNPGAWAGARLDPLPDAA